MRIEEELSRFHPGGDMLLSIGVFDGVHLGHRQLISELVSRARAARLLAGVVTFRYQPQKQLIRQSKLPFLTDLEERKRLLGREGVDAVYALSFTEELAQLPARRFISLLKKYLRMKGLVVGPDFALGRDREGDIPALEKLGQSMGFSVAVVPPYILDGEVVSSTAIRQALACGDIEKATRLFGRPYRLHSRVTTGAGRGAGLGYPTANLDLSAAHALPADGVYAGWTIVNGRTYPSMSNIGTNPTFDGQARTFEIFIDGYDGDLYGHEISHEFVTRLRDEKRFGSIEELKEQIGRDVAQGRAILETRDGD